MLSPRTQTRLLGNQFSSKPYRFIQTRGMKLSLEQATKAAAGGAKYIYRYIWKTEPVTPNMGAANLLSTQARIVKPTSPDFHRELREGEYDAYINHLDFFKKAKVLKIPTKHKSMKAAKGEYDVMLMESSRVGKEWVLVYGKMGLKGFANLPEIVEQGKSMASPHAAGRGHEPDTCLFNETFTVASDGTPEMGQTFTGIQAKNFTGTRGAEHKAEVSGNKAKNLENTPAVDHQTKPKVTVTETGETLVRYDIHHLVTFMLGKPKLDRGASKYYVDEKVWHDLEDKETIENLHQMEDYSTMDKYLE